MYEQSKERDTARRRRARAGRRWARRVTGLLVVVTALGCLTDPDDGEPLSDRAHLTARPATPSQPLGPGRHELGLGAGRDGWLYIPGGAHGAEPLPLLVLLHGATGDADNWVGALPLADSLGMVLLAPDARSTTWDVVRGTFGPDVEFIDAALEVVFGGADIDPGHVALAGFSDGASYALSLGIGNGDLFTHLIAWSPGFLQLAAQRGRPGIFISHGVQDRILPIATTSRRIVPLLEGAGYVVEYREFDGAHEIDPQVARDALGWFLGTG